LLKAIEEQGRRVRDYERRVNEDVLREITADAIAEGKQHGLAVIPVSEVGYSRVPSLWLLVGATTARLTRTAGENRSVKASDNHDRLHASAGAYFDVLVTEDAEFRETLALIPALPFEVLSMSDLNATLRDSDS
jgi:hypothetical protein